MRDIPVYTAGVNPRMIETAGRVADGLLGHTLFTTGYLQDVALPAIERGTRRTGRSMGDVRVASLVFASVHEDAELARAEVATQIAFYATAKTYAPLLERTGFGAVGRHPRGVRARRPRRDGRGGARADGRRAGGRRDAGGRPRRAAPLRGPARPRDPLRAQLRLTPERVHANRSG